ncbi:MAG: hypothetical protein II888_04240 [Clostridia bacterium]|nr:hypothetical protein [Clostridia bacterium]
MGALIPSALFIDSVPAGIVFAWAGQVKPSFRRIPALGLLFSPFFLLST